MPFDNRHTTVDRAALPTRFDDLRARLNLQVVNNRNRLLVLYADAEPGFESFPVRYAAYMDLKLPVMQGTDLHIVTVEGVGQIVVTDRRVLGMITDGKMGGSLELNENKGSVFLFAFDRDDIGEAQVKKNWLGKPTYITITPKVDRGQIWGVRIGMVQLLLKDSGEVVRAGLSDLLKYLTPGPQNLP